MSAYAITGSSTGIAGAPGRNRTYDKRIRRPLLYPLSYGGGERRIPRYRRRGPVAGQKAFAAATRTCARVGTPTARKTSVPSSFFTITVGVERMPLASASALSLATSSSRTVACGTSLSTSARTERVWVHGSQNEEEYKVSSMAALSEGIASSLRSARRSFRMHRSTPALSEPTGRLEA